MTYREETLQGGSAWPGWEESPELVLVTSQAEEDTLDAYALLTIFYNNFTTLLRDLYDSVEALLVSLRSLSGRSEG